MLKKLLIVTPLLILGIGMGLWTKGKDIKEVRTEITIQASPEKVWQVLSNFDRWQSWNPTVVACQGKSAVGSELSITMIGKEGEGGPKYNPIILELEPAKILRWQATMGPSFVFTNEKIIELQSTNSGTKLIHKELFSGMMVPLFGSMMEEGVPPILRALNEALKAKVEAG